MAAPMDSTVETELEVARISAGANLRAGIFAGLCGAVVMGLFSMSYSALVGGLGFYLPLREVAAAVVGVGALVGGGGTIVTGAAIHLGVGMAFGAFFAWVLDRAAGPGTGVVLGILYAGVILGVMTYFTLHFLDPVMAARVQLVPLAWVSTHLLFGIVLGGLTPVFRRAFV